MKFNSTKAILACFMLLVSFNSFSQKDFQGKAYYKSKTTIDVNGFGGGQLSEERKRQIMERMKSMLEKDYVLTFTQSQSIYKEEEKLEAPGQGGGFRMMGNFSAGLQYKNIKNNQLLQEQEFFGKQFLIKDSLPELEWEMSSETKTIGQYTCFKATAVKKDGSFNFGSFGRRGGNSNTVKDSTKAKNGNVKKDDFRDVLVTAWYTPQIPVSQGPGEYHGLPGLILEINADRTTILCSKIVLNPSEKELLKVPSKGKEVTQKEYDEIVKKKVEEMREMRRGRGGRDRRRR